MAQLSFDATTVAPASFDPLPDGWYNAIVIDSEWQQTKSGNGRYIKITLQLIDPNFAGHQLFHRFNMENPSADATRIAREQLSSLCHAVGVLQPKDTCELHNLPLQVRVKATKNHDTGDWTNEVKGFKSKNSADSTVAPVQAKEAPAPWKK